MKKFFKTTAVAVVMLLSICFLGACGEPKPKTFNCDAGLTITLTDKFYERDMLTYTMYLESSNVLFVVQKEDFETLSVMGINENSTVTEYAEKMLNLNNIYNVTPQVDEETDFAYCDYEKTDNATGKTLYNYTVIAKGSDAFWLCQFACESKNSKDLKPNFATWSKTIVVN